MADISYRISERTAAYLRWLSRNVIPEKTESLVARHLMMSAIEQMRREHGPPEPHSIAEMDGAEASIESTDKNSD